MLSLKILFIAVVIFKNEVYSAATQDVDLGTVFEIIRAQQLFQRGNDRVSSSSDSDSSSDLENRYGSLRENIEQLLERATENERQKQLREGVADTYSYRYDEEARPRYKHDIDGNNDQRSVEQILQLLQKDKKFVHLAGTNTEVKKQKSEPSYMLGFDSNSDKSDEVEDGLDKYSKIYVVLNPQEVQKRRNKNQLTDLLKHVLSLTSNPHRTLSKQNEDEGQFKAKEVRYKGFTIRNNINAKGYRRNSEEGHLKPQQPTRYLGRSNILSGNPSRRYLGNKKKRSF